MTTLNHVLRDELGRMEGPDRVNFVSDLYTVQSKLGCFRVFCEQRRFGGLALHLIEAQNQINELLAAHESYKELVLAHYPPQEER